MKKEMAYTHIHVFFLYEKKEETPWKLQVKIKNGLRCSAYRSEIQRKISTLSSWFNARLLESLHEN